LGELKENKNKEVENMLVLIANLEQIENSLEVVAHEVACIHQAGLRRLYVAAEGLRSSMHAGSRNEKIRG